MSVGLVFVLACGGADVATSPLPWELTEDAFPDRVPEPVAVAASPEAAQPELAAVDSDVADDVALVPSAVDGTPAPSLVAAAVEDEQDAVNKPTGIEAPSPAPAPAPAPVAVGVGQIQLTTGAGIQPIVDGVPMRLTTSQGFLSEVSAGKHRLEIRNLLGNVTGSAEVDVLGGRRTRYEWRRRSLSLLGDVASSPMPSAVDWDEVFATDDNGGTTVGDDKQPLQPAAAIDKK